MESFGSISGAFLPLETFQQRVLEFVDCPADGVTTIITRDCDNIARDEMSGVFNFRADVGRPDYQRKYILNLARCADARRADSHSFCSFPSYLIELMLPLRIRHPGDRSRIAPYDLRYTRYE